MQPSTEIRSTLDGHHCPCCGTAYPSLYWFKRDRFSDRVFCLECAKDLHPDSLRDFLGPDEVRDETTFSKVSYLVFSLLVALSAMAQQYDLAEVLKAATKLEFCLEGPAIQILSVATVLLLIGELVWLAVSSVASRWAEWKELHSDNPRAGPS